jgi:hypothetical protein
LPVQWRFKNAGIPPPSALAEYLFAIYTNQRR